MARWQLLQAHYLNVPGTTWEYKEAHRTTGRPMRREFPVPLYLNPEDSGDCNYRSEDEGNRIIVSTAHDDRYPNDIIFVGFPTPDMLPLDDEAKAISASFEKQWAHPIEGLPNNGQSYSQSLVDNLQGQLAAVQASEAKPAQIEGMSELLATMAAMMKQNQEVLATLAAVRPGVAGGDVRRL